MANTFKGPNVKSIHGYADHIYTLRQYSRGNLKIKSANPHEHPAIDPKSLSHPEDLPQMVKERVIRDLDQAMMALESQILKNPREGCKTNTGTLFTRGIEIIPRR